MSSSSSTSSLGQSISEKLTWDNYLLWKAQVVPVVRGAQLYRYLDGTKKVPPATIEVTKDGKTEKEMNPAYEAWLVYDQQVLGILNASLSQEVLGQVAMFTTTAKVWAALQSMFMSQSRAGTMQLCTCLANTRKGDMMAAAYFGKMKGFANEMAAAGKPLDYEDLISYILTGLDHDYNSFVENVSNRSDPISLSDLYGQFLVAEARIELQNNHTQISVNATSHGGRGGNHGGRSDGGNCGGQSGYNLGHGDRGDQGQARPPCQLCGKENHHALRCMKLFDRSWTGEEKMANAAAGPLYDVDMAWYVDFAATDHITRELDKLTTRDKYHGQEEVQKVLDSNKLDFSRQ